MVIYIDADKLKQNLADLYDFAKWDPREIHFSLFDMVGNIDGEPTADVAPVVHAHWETDKHAALDFCSSCGEAVERYVTAEQMDRSNYKGETFWNYCPHCGAKMDEEDGKQ